MKCVIKFRFRQLMTSQTLRLIFDHLKQWPAGKTEIQGFEYIENKKTF